MLKKELGRDWVNRLQVTRPAKGWAPRQSSVVVFRDTSKGTCSATRVAMHIVMVIRVPHTSIAVGVIHQEVSGRPRQAAPSLNARSKPSATIGTESNDCRGKQAAPRQ